MQWIIENQALVLSTLGSAVLSGSVAGWWVKQKLNLKSELLQQQLETHQAHHQQQIIELKQALQQARQEVDELDE